MHDEEKNVLGLSCLIKEPSTWPYHTTPPPIFYNCEQRGDRNEEGDKRKGWKDIRDLTDAVMRFSFRSSDVPFYWNITLSGCVSITQGVAVTERKGSLHLIKRKQSEAVFLVSSSDSRFSLYSIYAAPLPPTTPSHHHIIRWVSFFVRQVACQHLIITYSVSLGPHPQAFTRRTQEVPFKIKNIYIKRWSLVNQLILYMSVRQWPHWWLKV